MKRRGNASTSSSAGAGAGAGAHAAATEKKMERKMVEKMRRITMKGLCFKLVSLIPSPHFHPEMLSQGGQLEQATNYIVQLRERVEQLKERKAKLTRDRIQTNDVAFVTDSRYPIVEIKDLGSSLEVILISRLEKNFMLFQVISILEEEGAEVVGVNVVTVGNKVYHTLQAQVKIPRVGVETSRIGGRLQELISDVTPLI